MILWKIFLSKNLSSLHWYIYNLHLWRALYLLVKNTELRFRYKMPLKHTPAGKKGHRPDFKHQNKLKGIECRKNNRAMVSPSFQIFKDGFSNQQRLKPIALPMANAYLPSFRFCNKYIVEARNRLYSVLFRSQNNNQVGIKNWLYH